MKSILINPLGTTPMVASEMFSYLRNTDENLNTTILMYTQNDSVKKGALIAKEALNYKYPKCRVIMKELCMNDIKDDASLVEFMSEFVNIINEEKNVYKVDKIYLNVSGGRKIQNIILSIYAGLFGIDSVYNVFDPSMQNVNERYEQIKFDIFKGLDEGLSPKEAFLLREQQILDLFFPPLGPLVFLEVNVIKFPEDEKRKLAEALNGVDYTDGHIENFRLKSYKNSGLITFDRTRTYPTNLGEVIKRGL
ncbi:MAG: CRISPR-associated protein Csx14 [Cuniculiplasma sp.]